MVKKDPDYKKPQDPKSFGAFLKKRAPIYLGLIGLFLFSPVNAAFEIKASTAILQDYLSGEILFEKDADKSIYPASMTKIMTSIIAFDLIKEGSIKLEDKFLISEKAWRLSRPGYSSMFIMLNDEITVENLLKGIIVVSGNDACVALAEGIAGSEEAFATLMTSKAFSEAIRSAPKPTTEISACKRVAVTFPNAEKTVFLIPYFIP